MNKTAEEYLEYIEALFVRLAQKLDGAVDPVAFANMSQALGELTDERMSVLKENLETSNEWEVLAKFTLPAVLSDMSMHLIDDQCGTHDDTD